MSSSLLLIPPAKVPAAGEMNNDGVLQAWEIYSQLHLKAELVVLSACETGRGQNVRGEGIIGLTRALQYAGARSVVASQWAVSDASTATLMVAFNRGCGRGWRRMRPCGRRWRSCGAIPGQPALTTGRRSSSPAIPAILALAREARGWPRPRAGSGGGRQRLREHRVHGPAAGGFPDRREPLRTKSGA